MKLQQPVSLKNIASLINATFKGDPESLVFGINEIHKVIPGDLTFVDFHKYYDKALNSEATFILINKEVEAPAGKAVIFSEDPFRDYNFLTKYFRPFIPFFSDTGEDTTIGEDTIIMPGVKIGNNVIVGKNCIIHPNVAIYDHCIIGDNVIIHANAVIGSDAFYFKKRTTKDIHYDKLYSCGRTIIENYVEIGAACTIDRGVSGDTIIGAGTKLDNQVHIGHGTIIGKNCLIAAQAGIAGKVIIEDEVTIWGQVGISKDLRIGKGAVILAQSGVPKSLSGGKSYFGSPVIEARQKMKEIALLKNLPSFLEKINRKFKQINF